MKPCGEIESHLFLILTYSRNFDFKAYTHVVYGWRRSKVTTRPANLATNLRSYLTKTDFTALSTYALKAATCLSSRKKHARSPWAFITSTSYLKHFFVRSALARTFVMRRRNQCYFVIYMIN